MASEVFRFVSVRPIAAGAAAPPLDLGSPVADSDFIHALRDARTRADRAAMLASAAQFVASPAFLSHPVDFDQRLIALAQALAQLDEKGFDQAAAAAVSRLLGQAPADYVRSDACQTLLRHLAESIVAAAIDPDVSAQSRALLAQIARVLAVIEGLAAGRTVGKGILFEGAVTLPTGIFPLPRKDPGLAAERAAQRAARDQALADRQSKLAAYAEQLDAHRNAIDEIMTLLIRAPAGAAPPPPPAAGPIGTLSPPSGSASDGAPRSPPASASAAPVRTPPPGAGVGFWIGETARSSLSERTRSVLDSVGLSQGFDPVLAVQLIQGQLGDASRQLNASQPTSKLIKVGSSIFPDTFVVEVNWPILPVDPGRNPGPCPPSQIDGGDDTGPVTVPTGHGEARVLGIADLMLVEQQLARYEFGEIAHIENVLRKERRERRFRTSTTTQTSTTTETEQTSDKEQDLSSTERFELQRQVQNVVDESASKQAGLTISGSYGPTVSATATANYTSNSSKQQSDSVSSNYARETTSRAVSRVQQRTLVRQFTQVVNRIAESNLHGFDNTGRY